MNKIINWFFKEKKYKTFDDLEFDWNAHSDLIDITGVLGVQSVMFFDNGFGVSVVGGTMGSYGDGIKTFEVGILKGTKDGYSLTYETPITEDVIGHQTKEQITEILKDVQKLSKFKVSLHKLITKRTETLLSYIRDGNNFKRHVGKRK